MAARLSLVAVGLAALLAVSCAGQTPDALIKGKRWTAIEIDGQGPLGDMWIRFEPDRVVGSGGCNGFNAEYRVSDGNQLAIGAIASTKKMCPGPLMKQERRFFHLLGRSPAIEVARGSLVLSAGAAGARFKADD